MRQEPWNKHFVCSFRGISCKSDERGVGCVSMRARGRVGGSTRGERAHERRSPSTQSHETSTQGTCFMTSGTGCVQEEQRRGASERRGWSLCSQIAGVQRGGITVSFNSMTPALRCRRPGRPSTRNEHTICSFCGPLCRPGARGSACVRERACEGVRVREWARHAGHEGEGA